MKTSKAMRRGFIATLLVLCLGMSVSAILDASIALGQDGDTEAEASVADDAPEKDDALAGFADDVDPDTTSVDGLWEIQEIPTGVGLVAYHGSDTEVTIPETVTVISGNTYTISLLGQKVFKDNTSLTSVTLSQSLKWILPNAFQGCTSLSSFSFADSAVTEIPAACFCGCTALQSFKVPSTITSIGNSAFQDCANLVSVDFDDADDLATLGSKVFMGCTRLGEGEGTVVELPSFLAEMGDEAFRDCTSLQSCVYYGEALAAIPDACFKGCTSLRKYMVPATVETIGDGAFQDCTGLVQVGFLTTPELTTIGSEAFRGCTSLETVSGVPKTVVTIKESAFEDCGALTSFTFTDPDESSLDVLGERAFANCSSLKDILVPFCGDDWSSKMGDWVFTGCSALESVGFWKLPNYAVYTPNAFSGCGNLKFCWWRDDGTNPFEMSEQYGLPETVTFLGFALTKEDPANQSVIIVRIKTKTESGATGSGSVDVVIPVTFVGYDITEIHSHAAKSDYELGSISFAEGSKVTEIGEGAFEDCQSMTSVTLPPSLTTLGKSAFHICVSLTDVTFEGTSLTILPESAFDTCMSLTKITLPEGLTTVSKGAFAYCVGLLEVYFPDSLNTIDDDAFDKDCHDLNLIRMPDSQNAIRMGSKQFYHCLNLNNLHFLVTAGSWSEWTLSSGGQFLVDRLWYEPVSLKETNTSVEMELDKDAVYTYNGLPQIPKFSTQKRWLYTMVPPTTTDPQAKADYRIEYSDDSCTNAGTATVTIVAVDNGEHYTKFKDSRQVTFQIEKADITDKLEFAKLDVPKGGCYFDEMHWTPAFKLKYPKLMDGEDYAFTEDDYIVSSNPYDNNVQAGTATLTVSGDGNFTGTCTLTFPIRKRNLSKEAVVEELDSQWYTGDEITFDPDDIMVSVQKRDGDPLWLIAGEDFTVSYENNVGPGKATVILTAAGNNMEPGTSVSKTFTIKRPTINDVKIDSIDDQTYCGAAIEPGVKVTLHGKELVAGKDYAVSYTDNVDAGQGKAGITLDGYAEGDPEGFTTVEFRIVPREVTVKAENASKFFGDADPELEAKVVNAVAAQKVIYSLTRESGDGVGEYKIEAMGEVDQGNYSVTFEDATFEIKPANISEAAMSGLEDVTYDGSPWVPEPTVTWRGGTLVKGNDYELSYSNNTDASTATEKATVTATGVGNFAGSSLTGNFEITRLDIGACDVVMPYQVHDGTALKPSPRSVTATGRGDATLALEEGRDYEVIGWRDNVAVGTGYATIKGLGNLMGTREDSFNILSKGDLSQGYVLPEAIEDQVYTGDHIEPTAHPYLTDEDTYLLPGVGYTVEFFDNVDVGEATVRFTGIEPLYGTLEATFRINQASIADAVVTAEERTYDGTEQKPKPTVTWHGIPLVEGRDYKVEGYADNVHAGTATVRVKGMGNFDADTTASGDFTIARRGLTIVAGSSKREYDGTPLTCGNFFSEGLAAGDKVTAKVEGSITDVGESPNVASEASVTNARGDDVDDDYEITYTDGTLIVLPYSTLVTVSIVGHRASALYDGGGHAAEGYDVRISDPLYKEVDFEHAGEARVSAADAGTYPMSLAADQFANVNSNFQNVVFEVTDGSLEVARRQVTLTSADASKTYDGLPLTSAAVEVGGDGWAPEHDGVVEGAFISVTGSRTAPGTSENSFAYELKLGTKASNYDVTTSPGTLEVTPRLAGDLFGIEVTSTSAQATYDGAEHLASGFEGLSFDVVTTGGATFPVAVSGIEASVSATDAGAYPNAIAGSPVVTDAEGNDVTDQFDVTLAEGTLQIDRRSVTLTSASAEKEYDGTPLTAGGVEVSGGGWAEGEGATYDVTGSQTVVGSSANAFSYMLTEGTKEANYEVTASLGTLTVTSRGVKYRVAVVSRSTEALYDGAEHSATGFETLSFEIDGNAYEVSGFSTADPVAIDVGSYANTVIGTPVVTDAEGNDVSSEFAVSVEAGALTIAKRSVSLTSASAEKAYDGTPLKADGIEVSGDGWAEGEGAAYSVTGSQTGVGSSENAFTYVLVEGTKGANYDVTTSFGTLKVMPADLSDGSRFSVAALADEVYDGEPHEPVPVVTDSVTGAVLARGADFTLAYRDNVAVGTATVTVTGAGNYSGSVDTTFRIVDKTAQYVLVSAPSEVVADGRTAPEFTFSLVGDDAHTFDHFAGVKVDGRTLVQTEYDARRGSVVITLKPTYVKTLSAGRHTLTAVFDDGEASATFTVKAAGGDDPKPSPTPVPQTSDTAIPLPVVLGVAAAGIAAVVAGIFLRRKK